MCVAWDKGDLAEKLVKHGARTDICNKDGENVLFHAYCSNKPAMVERLLALGVALTPHTFGLPSPPYTACDSSVFLGRTIKVHQHPANSFAHETFSRVAECDASQGGFRLEPVSADVPGEARWVRHFDELAVAETEFDPWSEYAFSERYVGRYLQACQGLPFV